MKSLLQSRISTMNEQYKNDWDRLVRKTRKRPLINNPVAYETSCGMKVCANWLEQLLFVPAFAIFGAILVWGAIYWTDAIWAQVICFVVGVFILWGVAHRIFFPRSLLISEASDEAVVKYGFFLLPTRLVVDRRRTIVDYLTGAETKLHSSLKGFKFIVLRNVETDEVVHFGATLTSENALRVFDPLSKLFAGGGHNAAIAVIKLEDGSLLKVDRLATWAAGHHRKYKNRLSVVANVAEIERWAFGENKGVVDRKADIYPVRIETNIETVFVIYSNHEQKSIPRYDCVAVQLCKEEIAERYTRYEINLIEDAFLGKRVNLMSFDLSPLDSDDEPRNAAKQLGELLGCAVVDHS